MAKVFNLDEIFKFAIEKEIQSFNLYKKMAELASDQKIKKIFIELMEQEQGHKDFFSKMLGDVEKETENLANEEYYDYIQELIDASRTISQPEKLNYKNISDILNYAIDREKDSILFYSGLKNLVGKAAHNHIDNIINEEGKHIIKIVAMKKENLNSFFDL